MSKTWWAVHCKQNNRWSVKHMKTCLTPVVINDMEILKLKNIKTNLYF